MAKGLNKGLSEIHLKNHQTRICADKPVPKHTYSNHPLTPTHFVIGIFFYLPAADGVASFFAPEDEPFLAFGEGALKYF